MRLDKILLFQCFSSLLMVLPFRSAFGDDVVFHDITFAIEPLDTIAWRDKPVVFHCTLHMQDDLEVEVAWNRNDLLITADDHRTVLRNGSLLLEGRPEEGLYQCVVTIRDIGSVVSRKARLQIAYLERSFVEEPRNLSVHLGDLVMFPCRINGIPKPMTQWYKDDKEVDQQNLNFLFHLDDGVLEMRSIQFADYGRYKCKGTNGERSKQSPVANLIQNTDLSSYQGVPPHFVMKPRDRIAIEGTSLVFLCGANGRDRNGKRPTTVWLRNGVTIDLIEENGRFSVIGESSLRIDSIEEMDAGLYTCRAFNFEDSVDANAQLTVRVPPKLRSRLRNAIVPVMSDKELSCDIYASPRSIIHWFRNGQMIVADDYVQMTDVQTLRILGFSSSDNAFYQCIALNDVGSINVMAQLLVQQKVVSSESIVGIPSAPIDVVAVVISMRFITLSWRQPDMFGLSEVIGYYVRWKESNSSRERELNTTTLETNVQHLKPLTRYYFNVYAYNKNGISLSASSIAIETQTEVAVPDASFNLEAFALSSTSIMVKWSSPLVVNSTITISGYKLYFYDVGDSGDENELTVAMTTTHIVRNLRMFHQYSFRVVAYNSIGQGSSSEEILIRTYSDVASAPPQNVSIEIQSVSSVLVRWEPVPEESQNGIITGYKIRYRQTSEKLSNVVVTDGIQVMCILTDLKKGTEYSISIQAQTVNGTGPATAWIIADTLTHELDETTVPGEPSSLQVRPQTNSIVVSWTPPIEQDILIRGYILGFGIGIPDVFREILDAKTRYFSIKELMPSSEYVISLKAYNNIGEGKPKYETTITREETTPEPLTPIIPPVGLKAVVLSSNTIVLTWTDTTLGRNQKVNDKRYYTVRYTPRAPQKYRYINSTDLNIHIEDLRPDTEYEFSVKIIKGRRQSTWSLNVFDRTKEASPASAPKDVTPVSVELRPSWVSISWQPPRQTNGQITGYLVLYTTDTSQPDRDWVVEGVLGDRLSTTIKELSLETIYYFKVQARNSIGYSPMSSTVIFRTPRADGNGGGPIDTPDDYGRPTKFYLRESDLWSTPTVSPLSATSVSFPATILWISIGCIGGLTVVTLITITAVVCYRRKKHKTTGKQKENGYFPPTKGKNGSKDLKPPDLWFHDQMKMKNANKSDDADEETAMMSHDCSKDLHGALYDSRISQRPKASIIPVDEAPQVSRDYYMSGMANSQPIGQAISQAIGQASINPVVVRPVYPRTQYTSHYATGQRVNAVGSINQQILFPSDYPSSTIEEIKERRDSVAAQSGSSQNVTGSESNPIISHSLSKSPTADCKSFTTEELTEEMANLEGLMKDLSAITQHQFEC